MFVQGAKQRDDALGFVKMPQGYELWQIDNHWMWMETRTQRESEIHWNKWAISCVQRVLRSTHRRI